MGVVFTDTGLPFVLAEQPRSKQEMDRELRKLCPDLFCELHLLEDGRPCWTVQEHVGERAGGSPFRTVCYWADQHGRPLPLTHSLVEHVKRLEGGAWQAGWRARNDERAAKLKAEVHEHVTDVVRDVAPRLRETRSAVLPRSVSLRMARDRRRARGEKA